jgi:hypothetical protein
VNLAIILSGALFLYVYFCINPFSVEEMDGFRVRALNNVTLISSVDSTGP